MIALKNRFKKLKSDSDSNQIKYPDSSIEYSRIVDAILSLLKDPIFSSSFTIPKANKIIDKLKKESNLLDENKINFKGDVHTSGKNNTNVFNPINSPVTTYYEINKLDEERVKFLDRRLKKKVKSHRLTVILALLVIGLVFKCLMDYMEFKTVENHGTFFHYNNYIKKSKDSFFDSLFKRCYIKKAATKINQYEVLLTGCWKQIDEETEWFFFLDTESDKLQLKKEDEKINIFSCKTRG